MTRPNLFMFWLLLLLLPCALLAGERFDSRDVSGPLGSPTVRAQLLLLDDLGATAGTSGFAARLSVHGNQVRFVQSGVVVRGPYAVNANHSLFLPVGVYDVQFLNGSTWTTCDVFTVASGSRLSGADWAVLLCAGFLVAWFLFSPLEL